MQQDREFWVEIRAAKLRIADTLQQQRAAVLEEVAAIERRWDIEPRPKGKRTCDPAVNSLTVEEFTASALGVPGAYLNTGNPD